MAHQKTRNWNAEKPVVQKGGGISFERIVFGIASGNELISLEHPNQDKYPIDSAL
jgi:hypothetical protein